MLFVHSLDVCDLCLPPTKRNPPQQQWVVGGDCHRVAQQRWAQPLPSQVRCGWEEAWEGHASRIVVRKAEASLKVVYASRGRLSRS